MLVVLRALKLLFQLLQQLAVSAAMHKFSVRDQNGNKRGVTRFFAAATITANCFLVTENHRIFTEKHLLIA